MTSGDIKHSPVSHVDENISNERILVLHNDDVHTFDYVIDALIEICEHSFEQAVQCTYLVHHKGKCDIRKGSFTKLKVMKDALTGRELDVTID